MNQTRIDTKKLQADVLKASELLAQAMKLLAPYLPELSDEERSGIPRARTSFFNALPAITAAAQANPEVAKTAGFDPTAASEDAANVQAIAPLAIASAELARRIADASLLWTGEVFSSASALYRVAKSLAAVNPALRTIVDSTAPIFTLAPKAPRKVA